MHSDGVTSDSAPHHQQTLETGDKLTTFSSAFKASIVWFVMQYKKKTFVVFIYLLMNIDG